MRLEGIFVNVGSQLDAIYLIGLQSTPYFYIAEVVATGLASAFFVAVIALYLSVSHSQALSSSHKESIIEM